MKALYIAIAITLVSSAAICQDSVSTVAPDAFRYQHSLHDFTIGVSPVMLFKTPNGTQFAGGIKVRMFLGRRFSFDSDLVIGRDYVHAGPGIIGIPLWIVFLGPNGLSTNEESTFAGVLLAVASMILSAEHMAYHIPLNKSLELSPYLSLLRYKSSYKYGDYSNPDYAGDQLSSVLGIELNKYVGRFVFSPFAEWNFGYIDHLSGFNTGFYFGFYFPSR